MVKPECVAATFANEAAVGRCIERLLAAGFDGHDVTLVSDHIDDEFAHWARSWAHTVVLEGTRLDDGGHVVAVEVYDSDEPRARQVLEDAGGTYIQTPHPHDD